MFGDFSLRLRLCSWVVTLAGGAAVFGGAYFVTRQVGGSEALVRQKPVQGPCLERWKHPAVQLGEGEPGEVLHGTLPIRNIGTEPLTFSIKADRSCVECTPREGRVLPGETQEVRVTVRL